MNIPRTCLWVVLDGLADDNYGGAVALGIRAGGKGAILASKCNHGMADKVVLAVQDRERCLAQLDKSVIVNQALG